MADAPHILLINPWITDFAAHDLWAKPLGLLSLASLLRQGGCEVSFVDCLDRHDDFTNQHPHCLPAVDRKFGTGKFSRMVIPKPEALAAIPRRYFRHGVHLDSFTKKLIEVPRPDLIWVTCIMTYWYLGAQEAIAAAREVFPDVPVWLGGIYATLCAEHAQAHSGADRVLTSPAHEIPRLVEAQTGFALTNTAVWADFRLWPPPALDLAPPLEYAPVMTSVGCPYRCPYCASAVLQPRRLRKTAESIAWEIFTWSVQFGVTDFAFYDDALLLGDDGEIRKALRMLCRESSPRRFHTPNALHIRALTQEWCDLLFESGFRTLRIGLETTGADRQQEWGGKVETEMFYRAVENLKKSGYSGKDVGAYLLCGMPGQTVEEVEEAIRVVASVGAIPYLCEYSPVPGTAMWKEACAVSAFDLEGEPLYQNNSFFGCRREDFSLADLQSLKEMARRVRSA